MQANTQLSRRALLSGSAASLALPLLPRRSRAQSPAVSEAAWRELGKNITGGVLRPNDPRFVRLTQPENLRYYNPPSQPGMKPDPDAPFGVVRPHSAQEVAYAITWARDNKLPMVPRSGGHSYAGCSTVPGLVINSSAMQSVSIGEGDVIEAGGGALFGNLLASLRHKSIGGETGRYTITHGRCGGVGLSAYLMGGGLALDSPHAGMGCDRVAKVEIVLADGSVVHASEHEHRDLFWAVRGGGGGNFGFATKWWLNPIRVDKVVAFSGTWRLSGNADFVFRTLLRAIDAAPDTLGAEITLSATSTTVKKSPWPYEIKLVCQLHGSRDGFDAILGPALAAADQGEARDCSFKDCASKDVRELGYWDAQEFFEIQGVPNRYQETSSYAREVSDDFLDEVFRIWPSWPATASAARLSIYRLGGKVNVLAPGDTAYVHRTARWLVSTDIDWSGGDSPQVVTDNLDWQRNVHNTFSMMLGRPGSYYNFPDPGLINHGWAYWGSNLPRLFQIKARYDPDLVFTPPRNQGISP